MSTASSASFQRFFWIGLLLTTLRIIYLWINQRDLDIEEAQYWTWSQHLALGYHSKPPLISWVIHFSTYLFGNQEPAIRLTSPITYFCSALLIYGCGKNLFNAATGFWAGVTVLLLPGVTYSATIISTDPLLILCWCLALFAFIKACQSQRIYWWLLCGLAIGLGLLSKYTMLAFFLSLILYCICSIENQTLWRKPGPYLAVLIAVLVFLPNAIWNTQHHNAAMHHVIEHNINIHGMHFHLNRLGIFLLSQFAILGPILFLFLIIALFGSRRLSNPESTRLLMCFTLPMLLLIGAESLLSRAYGNWAVVAYPSGIILAVAYMWEHHFRGWLKWGLWLNLGIAIVLYGWELGIAYGYLHWPQPERPNWHNFAAQVEEQHNMYPQAVYLVNDRELWSKTMYYGKIPRENLYVWDPDNTVDWVDNPAHFTIPAGKDFIFISRDATLPISMLGFFAHYQKLVHFVVNQRISGRHTQIYIYWLGEYRG